MLGMYETDFEKAQTKLGFTDSVGKIISGPFKDCDLYLAEMDSTRNGDIIIKVMPFFGIGKQPFFSLTITIPKDKVEEHMTTPGLTEAFVSKNAIDSLINPIVYFINKQTTEETNEIMKKESATGYSFNKTEKREFAKRHFIDGYIETPMTIYQDFKKVPKEFLQSEGVLDSIRDCLFSNISKKAAKCTSVESIIAIRAVTTQTVVNLVDVINEEKHIYEQASTLEKGLANFDEKMENKLDGKCKV